MSDDSKPLEVPAELDAMLTQARPELIAHGGPLAKIAVGRERALELTATLSASWDELIAEQLEDELSAKRVAQRRAQRAGLYTRAWVFYAADLQRGEVYANAKIELDELAEEVREHDAKLMLWALPLFGADPKWAAELADIARGRGRSDDADDVLRLVGLYRKAWDKVVGQSRIDKKTLDQAEVNARKLLDLLQLDSEDPTDELARRAYTLWKHDYDELKKLGRYLADPREDLVARFPGVRAETTVRRPVAAPADQAEAETALPADQAEIAEASE